MRLDTVFSIIIANTQIWFWKLLRQPHRIHPYKFLIQLSNDCNSRCENCHIWTINKADPRKKELELKAHNYVSLFKDSSAYLRWLAISGGEPTLISQFCEVIESAIENCPKLKLFTFTTNGLLPERALKYAKYIKERGKDVFVTISLDGDEEIHDRTRGMPGNFRKAQETYQLLKEAKIPCYYGVTVSSKNASYISKLDNHGLNRFKAVTFVHSEGIYARKNEPNDSGILTAIGKLSENYQVQSFSQIIEKIYLQLAVPFLQNKRRDQIIPCEVLNTSIHVDPYGNIQPCMYLPKLGSIKTQTLSKILRSDEAKKLKKRIKRQECSKCWMNCYAPHSIMQHPVMAIRKYFSSRRYSSS